jgi:hypothetical protein
MAIWRRQSLYWPACPLRSICLYKQLWKRSSAQSRSLNGASARHVLKLKLNGAPFSATCLYLDGTYNPAANLHRSFCRTDQLLRIEIAPLANAKAYRAQALASVKARIAEVSGTFPGFGKPIGFVLNYSPDFAVRFDLAGNPKETLEVCVPTRPGISLPQRRSG